MLLALRQARRAFTLVELIVVISIFLLVTALVVMATLAMRDKDQVGTGARHLQGYLAIARGKALAERRPVGIRLLPATQNPPDVPSGVNGIDVLDSLVFIHDPGDFAYGFVVTDGDPMTAGEQQVHPETGVTLLASDPLYGRLVYGPARTPQVLVSQEPYLGFTFGENPGTTLIGGGAVLPGDTIEFHGGGQVAQVIPNTPIGIALIASLGVTKSVYHPTQTASNVNRTVLVLDRKLDRFIQVPNVVTPRVNYRIMRSPRPIPGEQPLPFPNNVFVIAADRTGFYFGPPANGFTRVSLPDLTNAVNRDILFDPSGRVVGTAWEQYMFFVSDAKSALAVPADSNWALVTVYTRTGSVGSYPVDQQSINGNPYTFAQFGRGGL